MLSELLELMACRCYVHNDQQSTATEQLAAIKFFHKMFVECELPTSHAMTVAVGKGIDRAHGSTQKRVQVRLPLTWAPLAQERRAVTSMVEWGKVLWLGLALSYFSLCRASEMWEYANGKIDLDFCLTRNCLTFCRGGSQVTVENR